MGIREGVGPMDANRPWTAENQRHAGHADIIRELIDGSAGLLKGHDNLRIGDPAAWRGFRDRVEAAARLAGGN